MKVTSTDRTMLPAFSRRGFLQAAAGITAGLILPRQAPAVPSERKRVLRVAHLTDMHIQPELHAGDGVTACLRHVQAQQDKPDLILFGGDHVMDGFAQTRDRTQLQWDLWRKVLKAENTIPTRSCIGNHDIWGWNKKKSEATGEEPDYGKKWAVETLGLPNRYYSFTQAGWRFIALDSVQPGAKEGTYSAFLDEEQLAWLKKELADAPDDMPVLVMSHVPIVSAMPTLVRRQTPTSDATLSAKETHTDARALVELLAARPNVKACLSGHLHLVDHVNIKGVNFHCNGAVCGSWWKGPNAGFPEGYALLNLYNDGSYTSEYVAYGWKADQPAQSP